MTGTHLEFCLLRVVHNVVETDSLVPRGDQQEIGRHRAERHRRDAIRRRRRQLILLALAHLEETRKGNWVVLISVQKWRNGCLQDVCVALTLRTGTY